MESISVGRHYRGKYIVHSKLDNRDTPFAEHFLLQNATLNRLEILKRGRNDGVVDQPKLKRLFEREVEFLTVLRSRHFAPVFEFDAEVPEISLGAQYYQRPTLEQCLINFQSNPPEISQLFDLAFAIHAMVAHCHASQIALGNLDPSQLLVIPGNELLIAANDLSCAFRFDEQPLERNSESVYAAPELNGNKPVRPAADVFGLGLIFFALFSRTHLSRETPFRGLYGGHPPLHEKLREVLEQMICDKPGDRISIDETKRELLIAKLAIEEGTGDGPGNGPAAYCPHCRAPISRSTLGQPICPDCGGTLERHTQKLTDDSSSGANPVEKIYKAQQLGASLDIVFWARAGLREGSLSAVARLIALEAAVSIPHEFDLAQRLIDDFPIHDLGTDQYLHYLGVLGNYLWETSGGLQRSNPKAKQQAFAQYHAQWDQAVREQPGNADLWRWCLLAVPIGERESIIRKAMQVHPENPWFHYFLGETLGRQQQFVPALLSWAKAVELGLRELPFLLQALKLAENLRSTSQQPEITDAYETLRRLILAHEPHTPAEFLQVIEIARSENDRFRERRFLDQALARFPGNTQLQECDAQTLYRDGKREIVIENYGNLWTSVVLVRRVGLSYFHAKDFESAKSRFEYLTQNTDHAADYYYLSRSQVETGDLAKAIMTVEDGMRRFPKDPNLLKLREQLRQIDHSRS